MDNNNNLNPTKQAPKVIKNYKTISNDYLLRASLGRNVIDGIEYVYLCDNKGVFLLQEDGSRMAVDVIT